MVCPGFECLALPYYQDILRAAIAALRNYDDAQDLAQDVYSNAWASFHRFQAGTNCRAWLGGIFFHRLYHHRRKQSRWVLGEPVKEPAAPEPVPIAIQDPEILAALASLPTKFREVLLLADVEQYTYREIAVRLAVPIGTVMSRLSRGRMEFRRAYRPLRTRVSRISP